MPVMPVDDLPIDVLTELGRVTWAAINLEDYTESMCAFIDPWDPKDLSDPKDPSDPRTDMGQVGQKIKDAQMILATKTASSTRDQTKVWLERARQAIERRNAASRVRPHHHALRRR
jgi:hypothetical protein